MRLTPFVALAALACDPFGNFPDNHYADFDQPLWDEAVVPAADGSIYVRLPRSKELVRVQPDGSFTTVDLDGAAPQRIIASPSGEEVVVFAKWPECDDDDPEIVLVSDCPPSELSYNAEIAVIKDGQRISVSEIPGHMNAVTFSNDGNTAVTYLDYEQDADIEIDGLVDLTEVVFVSLTTGETSSVSIGFSPNNILFTQDNSKAVIMSRSKVVAVDLATYEEVVSYPLVRDQDQVVEPSGAVLTPDGTQALVSIENEAYLYKLDLQSYSIDIEDLAGVPADLAVDPGTDETLIVYASLPLVDLFDNQLGEVDNEPVQLDEPVTGIELGDGMAILYNDRQNGHDVYRLDLETNELTEFVVDNPVATFELVSDGSYAVGVLTPENSYGSGLDQYQDERWGLAVIDLLDDDAVSLVLEAEPVGLELVQPSTGGSYALVLMDGVENLLQVDLSQPSPGVQIELPSPPTSISAMLDGSFLITHETEIGELSFLDPETSEMRSISGFAVSNLLEEQVLPRRTEEN